MMKTVFLFNCFSVSSHNFTLDLLLCHFIYFLFVIKFSKIDSLGDDPQKLNRKYFQDSTSFHQVCFLLRKEVIHPHVPVGIPCYDLTPVINPAFDGSLLLVVPPASGITDSHGLTGGVYKARERIHRDMLIRDY